MKAGYFLAVQEMHLIFRKEEHELKLAASSVNGKNKHNVKPPLITQRPVVEMIAKSLKLCQDFMEQRKAFVESDYLLL